MIQGCRRKVKIGDLVSWEYVPHEHADGVTIFGVVLQLSKTGESTESAYVLGNDTTGEKLRWIQTTQLKVLNEDR